MKTASTGLEEDQLRLQHVDEIRQPHLQGRQILLVASAGLQLDVNIRALLLGEVILLAVHAEGEDARILREQDRVAIALMHVQVDDHYLLAGVAILAEGNIAGHGDIIEDAEALAVVIEGMMCTSRNMAGE